MLAPLTPNKKGTIVKIRSRGESRQTVAFKVHKLPQVRGHTHRLHVGQLSSAARRLHVKSACDVLRTAFPMLDVDESGVVFSSGAEAARYDIATGHWVRRSAWAGIGMRCEHCVDTTSA